MTPIRTSRFALAAALLTGIAGVATFPAAASTTPAASAALAAGPAATSQPLTAAVLTGATPLTLSNGTRVAVEAPRPATAGPTNLTGRTRGFITARAHHFCFFGALQSHGPRSAPARPDAPKYTLTIKGRNLVGAPDTGDQVQVYSATSMRWNENTIGPTPVFQHGQVTLHVPAGKYWLIGQFSSGDSFRMDIPAQITVAGDTTASVSARAASSEVTAATPRPAVLADAVFSSSYTLPGGQTFEDCGTLGDSQLWVSPLARAHTAGTLYSATAAQLNSPPGQAGLYTYELDSAAPPGTITSQHLTVTAADLATVHERFYSDTATTAPLLALGGPARQYGETGFTASSTSLPMPSDRTFYFQAQPTAVWRPEIAGPLAETPVWQLFHTGQNLSTNWNSYPLHPAPNLPPSGVTESTLPSAVRAANKLIVDITPFSDNTPGHAGSGLTQFNRIKGSGHFAIYANGIKLVSGPVRKSLPFADVYASAPLSAKPSRIKFTLATTRHESGSNLSGTSQDAWTWPSQGEPHAIMPTPWYCGDTFTHGRVVFDHHCAVQDMMTLDYQLAREGLDGSTPAGPQALGLAINHLPTATPYPVTRAKVQVSFDHGTDWQPATLARICHARVCTNQYRATYTAPAGAQVSLRVTARDTHGATVTETILGAYQTA